MAKTSKGDGKLVAVRLTNSQHKRIEAAAAREGLGVSTWMRRVALKAIEGTPAP
jgi:predicted HicB family RNase H-like nuclease